MAISDLAPRKEAERVLLAELQNEGKPIKTGELVRRAVKQFPTLTPSELRRKTPSGAPWWPGYFRFVLDLLKKNGETRRPTKGCWEITKLGDQRLSRSVLPPEQQEPDISDLEKEYLDWMEEVIEAIRTGEVQAIIRTKRGGFTVELGEHIKETQIVLGKI